MELERETLSDILFNLDDIRDEIIEDSGAGAAASAPTTEEKSKLEKANEEFSVLENEFNAAYEQLHSQLEEEQNNRVVKLRKLYDWLSSYRKKKAELTAEIEGLQGFKGLLQPSKKKAAQANLRAIEDKYADMENVASKFHTKLDESILLESINKPIAEPINAKLAKAALKSAIINYEKGCISAQTRNDEVRAAIQKLQSTAN